MKWWRGWVGGGGGGEGLEKGGGELHALNILYKGVEVEGVRGGVGLEKGCSDDV